MMSISATVDTASSEWDIHCHYDLTTVIQVSLVDDKDTDSQTCMNYEDIVAPEWCFYLQHKESDTEFEEVEFPAPEIKVQIPAEYNIKSIDLVTESRLMELFGTDGEYTGTYEAASVDEDDDVAVYCGHIKVDLPHLHEFTLKFFKLRKESGMWLYGIHLTAVKHLKPTTQQSSFTKTLLNAMNLYMPLSQNQFDFNKLSKNLIDCTITDDPQTSSLENKQQANTSSLLIDFSEPVKSVTDINQSEPRNTETKEFVTQQSVLELKKYIDEKCAILEDNIVRRLEQRLEDMEEIHKNNIETLIQLLQNKN